MTIHCAVTYFDSASKTVGYLLGSDSTAIVKPADVISSDKSDITFSVDKSFMGKNTIGFIRGSLKSNSNNYNADCLDQIKSLDNQFEDITIGRVYSSLPVQDAKFVLMIGKRNELTLDLYTLSNDRTEDNNKALSLCSLNQTSFYNNTGTMSWYSPCWKDYMEIYIKERLGFNEAKKHIVKLLTDKEVPALFGAPNYNPGKPNIFVLNFQGIHKIDVN